MSKEMTEEERAEGIKLLKFLKALNHPIRRTIVEFVLNYQEENEGYQIEECCPDKNLAVEEAHIYLDEKTTYIKLGDVGWDLDFCPFCGIKITVTHKGREGGEETE